MMNRDQYFKIRKEHIQYKGERYFRFNHHSEKTVQVCLFSGEEKKGKSNTFGTYLIHRLTFLSNYLAINYVEPCSKKEYQIKFNKAIKMLNA